MCHIRSIASAVARDRHCGEIALRESVGQCKGFRGT